MRPKFEKIKNYNEFKKFRWTRAELISICKEHGLKFVGTEKELNRVIESYFNGVVIPPRRNWYTNMVLCSFVNENGILMFIPLVILLVSAVLCVIGIINKVRDTDSLYYVPHLVFGVPGMILAIAGIVSDRIFDVIKSYFPQCGDKRFTRAQVDEQANSEQTKYLRNTGVFLAPDMVIGSSAGVVAVAYEDISFIRIKQIWHTERVGSRYSHRYKDYYTYKVIVRTNKGKTVVISNTNTNPEGDLDVIYPCILKHNPQVQQPEFKKSALATENKPKQVVEGEGVKKNIDKAVSEQYLTCISVDEKTKKRFIRYKLGTAFMLILVSFAVAAIAAFLLYFVFGRMHHGRGAFPLLIALVYPVFAIHNFIKNIVSIKKGDIGFYSGEIVNKYDDGYVIRGLHYHLGYIEKMKPENEPLIGDRVIIARLMNEISLVSERVS